MAEIEVNQICKCLSQITRSEWVAVKFKKNLSATGTACIRFCEAVNKALDKDVLLTPVNICCEGAKRCFGWLKNHDEILARKLAEKTGITQNSAYTLVHQVPVLIEEYSGILLGRHLKGDVYISYACPESAMHLARSWQNATGSRLQTDISTIMSVCGSTTVKSCTDLTISLSFGCPDSRQFGGIKKHQLVIGVPYGIASRLCMLHRAASYRQ